MNLRLKYNRLKAITILLGSLQIPWGVFTGYCLGSGKLLMGFVALAIQVLAYSADYCIYLKLLELMTRFREHK